MMPTIIRSIAELRRAIVSHRRQNPDSTVGFVPTMGFLHEGHASLLRKSASDNGLTVLSIFVNPLQFGPNEDLDRYPRDEARDMRVAAASGVNIVFMPDIHEMYPQRMLTGVSVSEITDRLCGANRPGHFEGVATVVTKLFNIVQPDRAYFGMKDAQQLAVITRMTLDLNIPVEIVPCPIEREKDGLALSSRNVYLTAEQRNQALALSKSLSQVPEWIQDGLSLTQIIGRVKEEILEQSLADIEYVEIVTYPGLQSPEGNQALREMDDQLMIALAVRFGSTRLIDNLMFNPAKVGSELCFAK